MGILPLTFGSIYIKITRVAYAAAVLVFERSACIMQRIYNFSAGPAMLPPEVLKKAQEEMLCYGDLGMSVMEMSHRSPAFGEIIRSAESSLRKLMNIPSNYRVLFVQGGATTQFSAIPLNLLSEHKCADYIVSGQFSDRAMKEAKKYGDIVIAASSAGACPTYSTIPETEKSDFRPDADYVHICYNNTIYGTRYHYIPDTGNIPLVADVSSCILSEPLDVTKFGLLYASAQKNIAPAGLTVVIVREDLVGNAREDTPAMLNYKVLAESESIYNTPPCYSIYIAKLVFEWLLSIGGLEEIKRRNERKASLIYDYLDSQSYYTSPVDKKCRSMMNIVFVTGDKELDAKFVKEAAENGLCNLAGHSSVGGMRASIYNAMPYDGVSRLVEFMKKFARENPKL